MKKGILIVLFYLLPISLWSQVQIGYFGEGGIQYTGLARSLTNIEDPPPISTNPPSHILIEPQGKMGGYLSGRMTLYRDSSKRMGLYAGLSWSLLNPSFRIIRIPDSIYSGAEPEIQLKQHSFRFHLGIERRFFKTQNMVVQLGGMLDYLTAPKFSAEQPIFVNTSVVNQLVMGIHFRMGVYVPRTKKRIMLSYSVDHAVGYGFTYSIKHQFNSDIIYNLTPTYSYHQIGLSFRII